MNLQIVARNAGTSVAMIEEALSQVPAPSKEAINHVERLHQMLRENDARLNKLAAAG